VETHNALGAYADGVVTQTSFSWIALNTEVSASAEFVQIQE
jgi:hypothetical protein